MLRKIAQWQQEGIIAIFPQKVISVAEVLEDIGKFGVPFVEKLY